MVTKREVVEKRRKLYSLAEKKHRFRKGDKRVFTPRLCVICGRPLSSLILNKNQYVTIQSHVRFHLNKHVSVDACEDINSCYRTLRQKGELDEDDVGEHQTRN